ncbi:MAG: hypothetical protein M3348_06265 [Acidobacteriota bacterium]|nr:hypothetical protein [Acidobacteriota bacterium]
MDWLQIIQSLLPLAEQTVPGIAEDAALIQIALQLIERIKSQSGMTTDQIIDRAGLTLAENKIKLAADTARLGGGNNP